LAHVHQQPQQQIRPAAVTRSHTGLLLQLMPANCIQGQCLAAAAASPAAARKGCHVCHPHCNLCCSGQLLLLLLLLLLPHSVLAGWHSAQQTGPLARQTSMKEHNMTQQQQQQQ
jgi:hypothetical protein